MYRLPARSLILFEQSAGGPFNYDKMIGQGHYTLHAEPEFLLNSVVAVVPVEVPAQG